MQALTVRNLTKRFETGTLALENIDLDIQRGEFVCIVGPSGCGKTTLLRILAGLETRTSGSVDFAVASARTDALATAMVFQEQSLFAWMTVRQNIEFAFDSLVVAAPQRRARADAQLELVGLAKFADAYPHQLSGGMKQRCAVARAFAVDPELLFMDEPFGALDEQTRVGLATELLTMWERDRKTVVFVTHSIEEALTVSDRIVVLAAHPGRIRAEIDVPFARPRDTIALRGDPEFGRLAVEIWNLLRP